MRLISCYIENFGNLSNQSFDFNSNITSFYQSNGTGKSTLASFIKAMFYGLETYKSNSANFVDRMHYYPFNGQLFGGNLTFETNGKIYKIERFFDEKSGVKDTFTLYEKGDISFDYSSNIGEELFGINKASFERLLFINDEDIEIKTNSSINAKLNTLLEGKDDTDLDSIIKLLEEKSKQYKDKGKNSLVVLDKEELKTLKERKIDNERIINSLEDKYIQLEDIKVKVADLKSKQKELLSKKEYQAKLNTYNEYLNDIKELESKINALNEKYPNGVLINTDIDILKTNISNKNSTYQLLNNKKLTSSQEYEYEQLSKKYGNITLEDNDIDVVTKDIEEFNKISNDIDALSNKEVATEDVLIENRFKLISPTNEEIISIENKIENVKEDNKTYQGMDNVKTIQVKTNNNTSNKLYVILAIIFALLLILGVAFAFVKLIVGIIIMSISFIGLLVTGFMYLNNKQSNNNIQTETIINQDKVNLKNTIEAKETLIKSFFTRFGYSDDLSIEVLMHTLKLDLKRYEKIRQEKNDNDTKVIELNKAKDDLASKLNEFFNKYQINEISYQQSLLKLSKEYDNYKTYLKLLNDEKNYKSGLKEQLKENEKVIEEICKNYKLEISNIESKIEEIAIDSNTYLSLSNSLLLLVEKAKTYKENNKLNEEKVEITESLDDITSEIDKLEEKKLTLVKQISDDEFNTSTYNEDLSKIESLEIKIKEYKAKFDIFEKTIESLKVAEQNLKDKYIGPVKNKFLEYALLIENAIGEKLEMSKDFEISYERNGKNRSERHLSSGLRSICAFCFRLALLDNMFKDNKPFIILDDPFMSLDESHIAKVKEIIYNLSSKVQIIYFTCHESRKI